MLLKSIFLSICVLNCIALPHNQFFGTLFKKALHEISYLGSHRIMKMPSKLTVENTAKLALPKTQDKNADYIIECIHQIDRSKHQAKTKIIDGGIGSKNVIMEVKAPKGLEINSDFHFFGRRVTRKPGENLTPWKRFVVPKLEEQKESKIFKSLAQTPKPHVLE